SCINLPASQGQMVEKLGYINKEIIMGIRPENMCEPAAFNESRSGNTWPARVEVVERLGAETLLHVKIEDQDFISRTGPNTCVRAGDIINLIFAPDRIHLFDKENGQAIINAQ
ncbi:MAG: TOBE domain-containing protein, partial [Syntrophomonas sp.]